MNQCYDINDDDWIDNIFYISVGDDLDGDGFIGAGDNCPNKYNADQLDTDNDGMEGLKTYSLQTIFMKNRVWRCLWWWYWWWWCFQWCRQLHVSLKSISDKNTWYSGKLKWNEEIEIILEFLLQLKATKM